MNKEARLVNLRPMEILGRKALFSNSRIDPATIPIGLFAYELRENDTGMDYNEHGEPLPPLLLIVA